jgi:hypothetical protein
VTVRSQNKVPSQSTLPVVAGVKAPGWYGEAREVLRPALAGLSQLSERHQWHVGVLQGVDDRGWWTGGKW